MATVKSRLEALERQTKIADNSIYSRAERMQYVRECMAGLHPDVFGPEKIEAAKAMLESYCK